MKRVFILIFYWLIAGSMIVAFYLSNRTGGFPW